MSLFRSIYRNRYLDRDYAPRPAIIEAAIRYLEYTEMLSSPSAMQFSEWITVPRNTLSKAEKATKKAAVKMLNAWVLGDLVIEFQEKEHLPSRASIALKFLEHCLEGSEGCTPMGCGSSSLQEQRVFDEDEKTFKSTSLELLRNWFNGEIELIAIPLRRRLRVKQETNRDVAIPLNSERKLK